MFDNSNNISQVTGWHLLNKELHMKPRHISYVGSRLKSVQMTALLQHPPTPGNGNFSSGQDFEDGF